MWIQKLLKLELLFQNDQIEMQTLPLPCWSVSVTGGRNFEDCDFTPIYTITVKNISKSSKSNSHKNPSYRNFGHLNQSIIFKLFFLSSWIPWNFLIFEKCYWFPKFQKWIFRIHLTRLCQIKEQWHNQYRASIQIKCCQIFMIPVDTLMDINQEQILSTERNERAYIINESHLENRYQIIMEFCQDVWHPATRFKDTLAYIHTIITHDW